MLDKFLYGPDGTAPPPPDSDRFAVVGGNEETRAKLLSTAGSVGPLSASFVTDYPQLAVLALEGIAASQAREFIDYVLSPQGQQLLTRHGYLTMAELGQ